MRGHTHKHTFSYACTHTLCLPHSYARTHSLTYTVTHSLFFSFAHTLTHSNYLSLSHTHILSHTNSHINSHTLSQSLTHNSLFILFCDKTCSKNLFFCICSWMSFERFRALFDAQPLTREHFECLGDDLAQRKHLCFSPRSPRFNSRHFRYPRPTLLSQWTVTME